MIKHTSAVAIPHQTPTLAVMQSAAELQEQIRCRAYELYEQRGREDGHDLDDWIQAQSEVTQQGENRRRIEPYFQRKRKRLVLDRATVSLFLH